MKKYSLIFLTLGILLSFIPIYCSIGLIYTDYLNPELSAEEWLNLYHSKIMFGFFDGLYMNGLASFIPGIISIFLLVSSLKYQVHKKLKSLNKFFLVLSIVFTTLGVFRFM